MAEQPVVTRVTQRIKHDYVDHGVAGTRLPPMRTLSKQLGASPVTVHAAIQVLARMGLVEPRPGDGTYIARIPDDVPRRDDAWQSATLGPAPSLDTALADALKVPSGDATNLAGSYPDRSLWPNNGLRYATFQVMRRESSWERAPAAGLEALRVWFASDLGGGALPHEVTVTPGGQAAVAVALRALAPTPAPVLVESPTSLGVLAAARAAGHTLVPVPTDGDGVRPDALRAAFARTGARLAYLQPLHATPTGVTLAADRRAAVLQAVRDADAFLIEDDQARDLSSLPQAPRPLFNEADGHVVYVRTLTKSIVPSLRVGALVARGPAAVRLRNARLVEEPFVSRFLQEMALELLTVFGHRSHLQQLQAALAERRGTLVRELAKIGLPATLASGGYSVWVRLPEATDEDALVAACARADVIVNGGRPWFPAEAPGPHLRLSVAAIPVDEIPDAVSRLGTALTKNV